MAFGDKTLEYVIKATDHASSTLDHVGRNLDRTAGSFSLMGKAAKFAAIGVGLAITAVGVAFTAGVYAVVDFLKAAQEEIKVSARLTKVQKNAQHATKAQSKATSELADQLGLMAGVSNNLIKDAMIPLAATGMKWAESQDLISVALDLSAARGIKLSSVTTALAKAYNGTTTSLARYGIKVKDAEGNALSFGQIVDQLKEKFHGAARAAGNTDPWARLTEAWDQVKEALGKQLWPLFKRFVHWVIKSLIPWVKTYLASAFHTLATKIQEAWTWISHVVRYMQSHSQPWKDLWTSVQNLVTSFGHFVAALIGNGGKNVSEGNRRAGGSARQFASGLGDLAGQIATVNGYLSGFIDKVAWLFDHMDVLAKLMSMIPGIGGAFAGGNLVSGLASGGSSGGGGTSGGPRNPNQSDNYGGSPGGGGHGPHGGHARSTAYRRTAGNVYITVAGDTDPDGAAKRIEQHLLRLRRTRGTLAFL